MNELLPSDPSSSGSGFRITRFVLRNTVPVNLSFVLLLVVGGIVLSLMPVDVYPDVSLDEATIETVWLGASAEDVERLVTDRIEEKIEDIRGIDRILSDSKPDASLIRVKFRENLSETELDAAFRQLRAAVEQVTDLPEDAEKPIVTKISVGEIFFLLWVAVVDQANVGEAVLHDVVRRLKPVLSETPGVAKVDDKLIRDREVHIEADRNALRRYGLTLQDVADVLRQYNRNLPSGTLEQVDQELSIRAEGGIVDPQQLGAIVILKNPAGGHVYLRDVASIRTDFERKTFFARYNLDHCLALGITKTDEADSRVVAGSIHKALREFQESVPDGVGLRVVDDNSHIITSRLHVLTTNLVSGIVLVFLVLWFALGLRNSLLAIVGIPFSFCCAIISMHALGVTINAVSLIGLVLCAGMIVDDAIVVLESVYRQIEEGGVPRGDHRALFDAIVRGAGEVFWPVISSSATTVAAFLPLLLMTGVLGEFLSVIPKTVAVVLLASLFECLVVLPVHYMDFGGCAPSNRVKSPRRALSEFAERLQHAGAALYARAVRGVVQHRYLALLPFFAVAYLAYGAISLVGTELFPSDLQRCLVDVQVADEASLDQTGEIVLPVEKLALSMKDRVSGVLTSFGVLVTEENTVKLRNNVAQIHVELASTNEIGADSTRVAGVLRERIEQYLGENHDSGVVSYRVWAPRSGPPIGKPVAIRIESPDFALGKRLAERYKAWLSAQRGVFGIKDDLEFGRNQIKLSLVEDRASVHGITFLNLASVLRTANDGLVVSTFKDARSGEDLNVRLALHPRYRRSIEDLLDVDIRSPRGHVLRLGEIADLQAGQGYAGIPHYNGRRAVTITAELDERITNSSLVNQKLREEFSPILAATPDVRVVYGGQFEETAHSFASLREAYVVALILIYFLLATQFRSYVQPFIILSTVPFGWVGVVAGLVWSGYPFTVMSFIAIVGMSGVVVNDSILLVDCANNKRTEFADTIQALCAACALRLRPVLLTTITTVLGLTPLALGIGGTSRIWSPFASSFAWGLSFATLVTLLVVPAVYAIADDAAGWLRREARRGTASKPEPHPALESGV